MCNQWRDEQRGRVDECFEEPSRARSRGLMPCLPTFLPPHAAATAACTSFTRVQAKMDLQGGDGSSGSTGGRTPVHVARSGGQVGAVERWQSVDGSGRSVRES